MASSNPIHRERGKNSDQLADELSKRISLWLTIGNAAGLVACASKMVDSEAFTHLLLPASWLFFAGLVGGGAFNVIMMMQLRKSAEYWDEDDKEESDGLKKEIDGMSGTLGISLICAIGGFLSGILVPLVAITGRFI